MEHGEIPPGHRVRGCRDEPSCVAVEHLSLQQVATGTRTAKARAPRGAGSITRLGANKWKVTVDAGRDELGRRRRLVRTVNGTKAQASRAMASLLVELTEGKVRPTTPGGSCTVNELMTWYFEFARDVRGLEHSTLIGYQDVYEKWLAEEIGDRSADRLSPAGLDTAFARMRRAGLSRSRMNNALSALSGAYKWGRRHGKVLAPVLKLAAATGMRRGELSGLRRDRLRLERNELLVDTAVNDAGGRLVVKPTKTQRSRVVALDEETVEMLRDHLDEMDRRAELCGVDVVPDGLCGSV